MVKETCLSNVQAEQRRPGWTKKAQNQNLGGSEKIKVNLIDPLSLAAVQTKR